MRLGGALGDEQLVLIGGQAVTLWCHQLARYLGSVGDGVTSADVDFQGGSMNGVRSMSPLNCLASRVENTLLQNKQTERADRQLRAAVAIVPAYGRMLLDQGAETHAVTRLSEGVLRLLQGSPAAQRLHERGLTSPTRCLTIRACRKRIAGFGCRRSGSCLPRFVRGVRRHHTDALEIEVHAGGEYFVDAATMQSCPLTAC